MVLSITHQKIVRSQAAPLHNMLSEQTLGLVDYHVQHAPNANIGFIDGKANVQKSFIVVR